jgi:hypothetical protein
MAVTAIAFINLETMIVMETYVMSSPNDASQHVLTLGNFSACDTRG